MCSSATKSVDSPQIPVVWTRGVDHRCMGQILIDIRYPIGSILEATQPCRIRRLWARSVSNVHASPSGLDLNSEKRLAICLQAFIAYYYQLCEQNRPGLGNLYQDASEQLLSKTDNSNARGEIITLDHLLPWMLPQACLLSKGRNSRGHKRSWRS